MVVTRVMLLVGVFALVVMMGASLAAPQAASADPLGVLVGNGSCGETGDNVPDDSYCSWDATGTNTIEILAGSCTSVGSCTSLGGDVSIGENACQGSAACLAAGAGGGSVGIADGACLGTDVCRRAGSSGGSAQIGEDACTGGDRACYFAGSGGSITVGAGSCQGVDACQNAGAFDVTAFASIGNGSCLGTFACYQAGETGYASIGPGSCTGDSACALTGAGGSATITPGSCQGAAACNQAGANGGDADIGNRSCLGQESCQSAGAELGIATIGDVSCDGYQSCYQTGLAEGITDIGNSSCNGSQACYQVGWDGGSASIGNGSCNWANACQGTEIIDTCGSDVVTACSVGGGDVGVQDILVTVMVGHFSCNQSGQYDSFCTLLHDPVGNCEYNDVDKVPEECVETLQVRKYLYPFWDSGRFNLSIAFNGSTAVTQYPVGHNGNLGPVEVDPGEPVTVSESAVNTSLGNYRTTVVCYDDTGGFVGYSFGPSINVVVQEFGDVVCTFINQRIFNWFWWW